MAVGSIPDSRIQVEISLSKTLNPKEGILIVLLCIHYFYIRISCYVCNVCLCVSVLTNLLALNEHPVFKLCKNLNLHLGLHGDCEPDK